MIMHRKSKWLMFALVLSLVTLGCKLMLPEPKNTTAGNVLFQDDFSDLSSGWNRVKAAKGESDYADGAYRIVVNEPNVDIWSKPGGDFKDVHIEVDAYKVGGDRDNRFGLICRAADANHFYTFIVSSDGYYGIGMINGNEYRLLGMDALQPTDAIRTGAALNHIRADCTGNTLTMYINDQKLASIEDYTFTSGDVGLIAGTYDVPGTDILFDNFAVYQP
jgi:hypothetical protein